MKTGITLLRKSLMILIILCMTAGLAGIAAVAEETGEEIVSAKEERADNLSVTRHTTTIRGQEISYTSTTGTMAMDTDLGQYDLFFIAYTKDDVEDPAARPVTFVWNGGPGCPSLYLNLGLLGPDRLGVDENGMITQVPTVTAMNDYSLLDLTDLVFIDPVGTGFSRAAGDTDPKVFYDYDNDIQSVGDFIRVYVNRNGRWESPKYLAGESYGTVRCAGVCQYLMDNVHMNLNGLLMFSTINNFAAVYLESGTDLPYVTYLPTYAASAWYHHKAAEQYLAMDLETYLKEVRAFAEEEYQTALFRGSRLTPEEMETIAARMAEYIGLDKETILANNLRIEPAVFRSGLLKEQKLMCGRYDSRYTGPVISGDEQDSDASDPSSTGIDEAFTGCMNDIIFRKLQFQTDLLYETINEEVNKDWVFGERNAMINQEKIIHDCMSKNPFMKVWVNCGYYDLATPFFSAEWVYDHLFLNEEYRKNLSFTYYPSGHMFYMHEPSLIKFREEAEEWFGK